MTPLTNDSQIFPKKTEFANLNRIKFGTEIIAQTCNEYFKHNRTPCEFNNISHIVEELNSGMLPPSLVVDKNLKAFSVNLFGVLSRTLYHFILLLSRIRMQ